MMQSSPDGEVCGSNFALGAASPAEGVAMAVPQRWRGGVLERSIDVEEDVLASQFQQVWLQNQTPSPEYPFPIQPFFSTGTGWQLEPGLRVSDSEETDPLNDPVLTYISDMMEEEDTEDRTGMFIDCSSYQTMAQELTDLLTESSSFEESSPFHSQTSGNSKQGTRKELVNWLNNIGNVALSPSESYPSADSQRYPNPVNSQPLNSADDDGDDDIDGLLDLDQEMICLIQEEVAAHESGGGFEMNDKDVDVGTEECPRKLASLFPCPENGMLVSHCVKQQTFVDLCPQNIPKASWRSCPQALGSSEALKLFQRNEETSEELEKLTAMQKEKKLQFNSMLIECAKAIASDDITKAYKTANEIRERVSAYGDSSQRLAHHFVEALAARITGTGALLYSTLLTSSRPSAAEMLKAYYLFVSKHPNIRISHYFADQAILDACEGAERLHIIDFGILYGFPWPCLIKALSLRPGGPPQLRITGIDFPQPGLKPAERVEETGRRLAEYARTWGVPFEYNSVADSWENVHLSSLNLRHDEVLVVTCIFRLRHLFDETVKVESSRKVVLGRIRSMNPKVFVQGVLNGCYNSPFFLTRFSEALSFYGSIFDAIDGSIPQEHPERLLVEQQILSREILNIVACEGVERVERAESYKHWESRTLRAGFEQMPLNPEVYAKARAMLSSFHKDHGIGQDGSWLLMGWKNRVLNALTTWKPCR